MTFNGWPDISDWLIGVSSSRDFIIRCPQHVTDWSLRQAQLPRHAIFGYWRAVKARDAERTITSKGLMYAPHPITQQEIAWRLALAHDLRERIT